MKRFTASWTTAIAAVALLAAPAAGTAQQAPPSASQPSAERPASASQPSEERPASAAQHQDHAGAANEHLRKAEAALEDIPATSLTGSAKTKVAELKRRISALEQSASAKGAAKSSAAATGKRGKANWSTEVAAVDRLLTELLGAQSATGAAQPTGTSGAAAARTTTGSKSQTAVTLDETTRGKLQEVRTHVTAFAAAMSGTSSGGGASASSASAATPSSDDPSSAASASAPAAASPAAAPPADSTSPAPAASAAAPAAPATAAQDPAAAPPAQDQPTASPSPAASAQVDPEEVKRHLTAARESLSQLTQLPAAAQLTGDARTNVSRLITDFNELITTKTEWRASYGKVQTDLATLIGDQRTDESPAPAAGTAGAVGTSGSVSLDPAIRAKLIEFRTHLGEFEKAAGGSAASPAATPDPSAASSAPASPAAAAAAAASAPSAAPASSAPASTPSAPTGAATSSPSPTTSSATSPATNPAPASAASSTPGAASSTGNASTPATTAGTTGSTPATAPSPIPDAEPELTADAQGAQKQPTGHTGAHPTSQSSATQSEALRHIEAIEAILNNRGTGGSATAGTSGNRSTAAASSLNQSQVDEIRTHLNELKRILNQGGK